MISFNNKSKTENIYGIATRLIVSFCFVWVILPMLLLRGNYIFTIHDGLDSYGGLVQNIYENSMYFHMNQPMPFMHGLEGKYTFITFNLYDFFNCVFGYVNGQILTRITGVVLGFCFTRKLLRMLSLEKSPFQENMISLLSVAYVITPVAPNRMIGFATLPAIIILFLELERREKITKVVWLSILIPFFSIFDAVLVFCLGIWFVASIIIQLIRRRINWNLNLSFILQCVATMIVNWSFFMVALSAEDTNRGLSFGEKTSFSFDFGMLKGYLLDGQYHSSALQRKILIPFLLIGTIYTAYIFLIQKEKKRKVLFCLLLASWGYWFFSALVETVQECGFRTGILLIDGFQWGRAIGLMRIIWYIMFACVLFTTDKKVIWEVVMYTAICLQLVQVSITPSIYNDTLASIRSVKQKNIDKYTGYISYNDFYANSIFQEIKDDINYSGEGVAAYGYHPAVLMNNCFNTVDGYESVHSMEWQKQFREIIAPALDRYEDSRAYYDGWGGRMYLFGELGYSPTKDKTEDSYPLFIDTEAFEKYGGKYILSRAEISNAEDIGLTFLNDYDSEESMYHIWLYEAK